MLCVHKMLAKNERGESNIVLVLTEPNYFAIRLEVG